MRVLLALDGSPSSVQARDLAAELAWPAETTIRLLSAYEVPTDWTGGIGAQMAWVGDAEDALRDELTAELERLAEPLLGRDWQVDRRVVRGRPASAILDEARELDADLILVGSRGRGPLTTMLLGSTSAEVVDHATCPVLVARGTRISRLLVATDGSDAARAIPERLGAWDIFRGLPADVISVAPSPEPAYEFVVGLYTLGSYRIPDSERERLVRLYRSHADEVTVQLSAHEIHATPITVTGDAAQQIVDTARDRGSDLIVTGSRGLHGLERVILGSVARNVVLHAPCSVLVMKAGSPTGAGHEQAVAAASPRR